MTAMTAGLILGGVCIGVSIVILAVWGILATGARSERGGKL